MQRLAFVQNLDREIVSPALVRVCSTFGERFRGFMFRRGVEPAEGLLLVGARDDRLDAGIHMLFVSFDLTVVWINSAMEVVDKVLARSWHLAYVPARPARYVLEAHPTQYDAYQIGQKVQIIDA